MLVGYRWFDTKQIDPLFPFGHGLSYTTFKYGKAVADQSAIKRGGQLKVTVPVTNVGKVEGQEVVQLYIADVKSYLPRPVKELKGFSKVRLAPGETCDVTFTIDGDDLSFFDDQEHKWVAEPGKFVLMIGSSSRDIRSKLIFKLEK